MPPRNATAKVAPPTRTVSVRRIYVGDISEGVTLDLATNERILSLDDSGSQTYIYIIGE